METPATPGIAELTRPDPPTMPESQRAPARAPQGPPTLATERRVERERLVLIADSDVEEGKRTASAVATIGLEPILVHDGVEAMLTIQRMLPRAVVLDAALPKMFGFQVCEVVKRNEALRDTQVVLIGAIHHRDRYRRPPSELYGADVYLERPDLVDELPTVLQRLGLPVRTPAAPQSAARSAAASAVVEAPVRRAPAPAPARAQATAPPRAERSAKPAPVADELSGERAKAERLARIIVSDLVLYNAEKFDEAVRSGDVVAGMDGVLGEARDLFRQRIDERVRGERSYIDEELERVARERSRR